MPRDCSLQLDVYFPSALISDYGEDVIDWSVSSDPDHEHPYLISPRQYASQEIDPIGCTASIGTIEVGVIDPATIPGDQDSGWMTSRIFDIIGRRCRLRRYVNATIGWVLIADGPAGSPKMDASYAAYRWPIRDTRELERQTLAFGSGGVASIVPRGSVYGWGRWSDADGDHVLLEAAMDNPVAGVMQVTNFGAPLGVVNFAGHFSGDPLVTDEPRLVIDDDAFTALSTTQVSDNAFIATKADVLWRKTGETIWNVARPRGTVSFPSPFAGYSDVRLSPTDEDPTRMLAYVTLFSGELGDDIPAGFPANGDAVEVVIRYRGSASEEFPYYIDDTLGSVLTKFYTGVYSNQQVWDGIAGTHYDPAGYDSTENTDAVAVRFDADAMAALTERVLMRQEEPIEDGRAFTESMLYNPSGWIPRLDNDGRISPVARGKPTTIDSGLTLTNAKVIPSTAWNNGGKIVSSIEYDYNRYFIPEVGSGFETTADGLAKRPVNISYTDEDSQLRYKGDVETFDASAFSAVGTSEGLNLPGITEQADLLAQLARFDVLNRYRSGVQALGLAVRRDQIPAVQVGDWLPWDLSWLPNRTTGRRSSQVSAAQIISIRDDDCTYRTLELEESSAEGAFSGEPGYYSNLAVNTDDFDPGYYDTMVEVSDEETPP